MFYYQPDLQEFSVLDGAVNHDSFAEGAFQVDIRAEGVGPNAVDDRPVSWDNECLICYLFRQALKNRKYRQWMRARISKKLTMISSARTLCVGA